MSTPNPPPAAKAPFPTTSVTAAVIGVLIAATLVICGFRTWRKEASGWLLDWRLRHPRARAARARRRGWRVEEQEEAETKTTIPTVGTTGTGGVV